jgi:ligand-binding sensor domain-containing protein
VKKNAFILACFFCLATSIQAQVSKPLIFTHYSKKEGLASDNVLQIIQDKTGFIWLATDNGLQRYDGNKFVVFRHSADNPTSIPDNVVHKAFIDKKDRLFLACGKKIGIFDKTTFRFKEITLGERNAFSLRKIMEDDAGRLLLFFGGGKLFVYNETNNQLDPPAHLPPLPEGWTPDDLVVDPVTKRYWITGKPGLLLYDPSTKQYSYHGHNVLNDATIEHFGNITNTRHFFIDKQGKHWIVSWIPFKGVPELYSYDKATGKVSTFKQAIGDFTKSYFEIWGMAPHSTGGMWLYGMNLIGLFNDATGSFRFLSNEAFRETGIHYDQVLNVFEDRENNTWVGTNKGLYRCNPAVQYFTNVPNHRPNDTTVYNNAVTALLQTKNNGLWVCTWGDGLFSYDKNMQPIPNPVTNADVKNKSLHSSSMLEHSNGEIWAGVQGGEFKIYDPATGKVFSFTMSACEGNNVRQLAEDKQKNVWILTENGLLLKCAAGNWRDSTRSVQVIQRLQASGLHLYIDVKDNVWVCTDWQGLYKIEAQSGKILKQYTEQKNNKDGLMQDGASDILQYNDSLYLIAANGVNILNINTGRFTYLTQAEGLPSDGVVSFARDAQNNIWIGLSNGFCRMNIDKRSFVSYDVEDGITTNSFEVSSSVILPDGKIVMGTLHDFLFFDPKKVTVGQLPPDVVITRFTLVNKQLPLDSLLLLNKIVLPYNKNAVNIEFSTLSFFADYKISYMLEGFDTEWKTAGTMPEAIYTYLPPGNYTFKVKAENGDGVTSKKITSFPIKVMAPFWNTWWFYAMLVLIAAIVFYLIDKVRIERREALHAMRTQIAGDLHQEINTTLNNISLLSEMAKLKADKDVDRSKEYIGQIHDKSRRMITAMDDILWSIDPANDNMEKTLLRLTEFTQALKNQYSVHIEVTVDEKVRSLHLEMKRRHEFFILYTEALRAVVEYARSKATLVNINCVKNKLSLKLSGNTVVADRNQEETENCLREVSKRAESIGADLDIQTNNEGIFIDVLVPVK